MPITQEKILVWLPSPIGDAVLCTAALGAIKERFPDAELTFLANKTVREVLSGDNFKNSWIVRDDNNPFKIAGVLRKENFTQAILLKNSFASAMAIWLAGIAVRIGYARQYRGMFLNNRLYPPKLANGKFKPCPMIDYYLAPAGWLGADIEGRQMELSVSDEMMSGAVGKLPKLAEDNSRIVILVPGGAFGPSKCWPAEQFAKTADWLIENYNATILISVATNDAEMKIADDICRHSSNELVNLGKIGLSLSELKAVFSKATLVITNDTGPRHIAIALKRKVITLFGPNDPVWTETGYSDEIKIVGQADCAPCAKKICFQDRHICMESITVEQVCDAAGRLL